MDSFQKSLYDFVTSDEKKLETAFDISENWQSIKNKLLFDFRKDIKEGILQKTDKYNVDIGTESDSYISLYKPSWMEMGEIIICVNIESMNADDYYGIWRNGDKVDNKKAELNSYVEKNLSNALNECNLGYTPDDYWWLAYKHSGYDYSKIEFLKELTTSNRQALVKEYANNLCKLVEDFSDHIDKLIALTTMP